MGGFFISWNKKIRAEKSVENTRKKIIGLEHLLKGSRSTKSGNENMTANIHILAQMPLFPIKTDSISPNTAISTITATMGKCTHYGLPFEHLLFWEYTQAKRSIWQRTLDTEFQNRVSYIPAHFTACIIWEPGITLTSLQSKMPFLGQFYPLQFLMGDLPKCMTAYPFGNSNSI